ncbi:MAG: hypothetical protein WDN45_08160 [Caulobacteraceae bacterium]
MLRVTDLKLPLGHPPQALPEALAARLQVRPGDIVSWQVARRANDARKKSQILMVYSVDVVLADEASVLARFAGDPQVKPTPDTDYRFVARAPEGWSGRRPVVIGAGPCGLFAGLILARTDLIDRLDPYYCELDDRIDFDANGKMIIKPPSDAKP